MAKFYYRCGMGVSDGCVCWRKYPGWIAHAADGKVVRFNEELKLSDEEKKQINDFVDHAHKAPRDMYL